MNQKYTIQRNGLTKKNQSGHAEYFLHVVEKVDTIAGGLPPAPLIGDMSPLNSTPSLDCLQYVCPYLCMALFILISRAKAQGTNISCFILFPSSTFYNYNLLSNEH